MAGVVLLALTYWLVVAIRGGVVEVSLVVVRWWVGWPVGAERCCGWSWRW
jgi:hypothetical protein